MTKKQSVHELGLSCGVVGKVNFGIRVSTKMRRSPFNVYRAQATHTDKRHTRGRGRDGWIIMGKRLEALLWPKELHVCYFFSLT